MGATTQQTINWARQIVTLIVEEALKRGYKLSVETVEEEILAPTDDKQDILDQCFELDTCHIHYYSKDGHCGWVFLNFGNDGWDVLSNHTVNLNEELQSAYDLSDRIQRGET